MRELVYLSDRKLEKFVLDSPRKRLWKRLDVEGSITIPPFWRVNFSRRPDEGASKNSLDDVLEAIESSERASRWYDDRAVSPGDWIQFEAQLNYRVMDSEAFYSAVLFLDTVIDGTRLLLHGSPEHVVGGSPGTVKPELEQYIARSEADFFQRVAAGPHFLEQVYSFGKDLHRKVSWVSKVIDERTLAEENPHTEKFDEPHTFDFDEVVWSVAWSLDWQFSSLTAAWMAGYARVTAVSETPIGTYNRMVIATPLFVERAPNPAR